MKSVAGKCEYVRALSLHSVSSSSLLPQYEMIRHEGYGHAGPLVLRLIHSETLGPADSSEYL